MTELAHKEIVVLEDSKDGEIEDNVSGCPCFSGFRSWRVSDEQSATPGAERSKSNEYQKTPVPPAVEHIARYNNKGVLQTQLPLRLADEAVEHEPIEQEDYRQEYRELDGVEEHL